jgi:hypothetical protein
MHFGTRRGTPLALALATTFGFWVGSARADGLLFHHTIPREVDAYDFKTGGPFMAPPVPYGHYAKDYVEEAHKAAGCVTCRLHALMGLVGAGHSLFHHGDGADGSGPGHGKGLGHGGTGGDGCGGSGLNCGLGHGLFGHHEGSTLASGHLGHLHGGSSLGAEGAGFASTLPGAGGPGTFAPGAVAPSSQAFCGQAGCGVATKHSHLGHLLGNHGHGADGYCNDPGCGLCAGRGLGHGAGLGLGHGAGHGLGHGGGTGCGLCGGIGCASCLSGLHGHISSAVHGHLAGLHGHLASLAGALHHPKVSWFLGAGGPVPLTPGYVPYIVTTRSPRDFFAFPPMNPNDP